MTSRKWRHWTPAEDTRLEMAWGEPLEDLAAEFGRTRTSVYRRALELGLLGVPRGGELLTASGRRTGIDYHQLRRILAWAVVELHPIPPRDGDRVTYFWVDVAEVDEAVAKWLATETPEQAAKRHGCSTEKVLGRLKASGLKLPRKPRKGKHWRIPSATIDLAMVITEKRGNRLALKEAA